MREGTPAGSPGRHYAVRLVRGPFVRLPPHPEACDEEGFLGYAARLRSEGAHLAADLFSGAGGLSLGLEAAGYRVVLSVDRDREAITTHRHHFGGLSLDWDLSSPDRVARTAALVKEAGIELLAGGPPCQPFSRAGRSKIRHRVMNGFSDPSEERRHLWRAYLEVVAEARPPAVLMENVPDMALDQEMFILRSMVHELESLGYAVEERVVDTSLYGVPQFRQRLILVALRDGAAFTWPDQVPDKVTVWNAIGDLPPVDGGWRPEEGAKGWKEYTKPESSFQRRMREGVASDDAHRVYDHITRPVRDDDKIAFDEMYANTRYSDLPKDMRRYRADIFDDKYKRLDEDSLSRTITAHIAKDGYWYIHPRQNRTLTVREAARLQTFPDWYRFEGPPSAAFRQIGNAVPPAVGEHLGHAVMESLAARKPAAQPTQRTSSLLADWFRARHPLAIPWLKAATRWQVIAAEMILDRLPGQQGQRLWPLVTEWKTPADTLGSADKVMRIAGWVDRKSSAERLLQAAARTAGSPEVLDDEPQIRAILKGNDAIIDLTALVVPPAGEDDCDEPVLVGHGVLRVVSRFSGGLERRNRMSDGRLAVARMIGYGADARAAHLALIELAASICRPDEPSCEACPIRDTCAEALESSGRRKPAEASSAG
jgi:DNA (cytosine-5)-methyltransferase 1